MSRLTEMKKPTFDVRNDSPAQPPNGWWRGEEEQLVVGQAPVSKACDDLSRPVFLVETPQGTAAGHSGQIIMEPTPLQPEMRPLLGYAPAFHPRQLGDAEFRAQYNLDYAYIAGAMANGITSVEMVVAMAEAGMLGFFGAAGLTLDLIEQAIDQLKTRLGNRTFGMNLIHSPTAPDLERATVDCYLKTRHHPDQRLGVYGPDAESCLVPPSGAYQRRSGQSDL